MMRKRRRRMISQLRKTRWRNRHVRVKSTLYQHLHHICCFELRRPGMRDQRPLLCWSILKCEDAIQQPESLNARLPRSEAPQASTGEQDEDMLLSSSLSLLSKPIALRQPSHSSWTYLILLPSPYNLRHSFKIQRLSKSTRLDFLVTLAFC